MSNKLKACEEFWAIFIDLFIGIRKIAWKNIIGNALVHYCTVLSFQLIFYQDIPISNMLVNAIWGLIVGGCLGAGGSMPNFKQPKEFVDFMDKLNDKHTKYREGLKTLFFNSLVHVLSRISILMHYMIIDFNGKQVI